MNKVILKYDLDFDFILIAISCPLKDYRFCHFLNKASGLELLKTEDYYINGTPLESANSFSCYFYINEAETEYYLLANKGEENGYLIPEMKTSDYFLMIKNFIDDEDLMNLINAINNIPEVVVATEISAEKLKSKENLIF